MEIAARMSSKGQLTVPKAVREALGIGEGADFRAPLGRAVIGGLIASTFLTLLVIPTFYDILASTRARLGRMITRRP